MRRTPLHSRHVAAKARLAEVDGWLVAADFGDVGAEYEALRHRAAVIDLSLRGKLRVTGADRASFLHNMLTNDIRALAPGQGCNAAKLDLHGKMEGGLHVLCLDEALLCDIDPGPAPRVAAALEKHLVLEDAKLEDETDRWALLAVQGPMAAAVLAAVGATAGALVRELQHAASRIAGRDVHLVRMDHSGEGGFDVWVRADDAAGVWDALVHAPGASAAGLTSLDVRRIEAGIPWYGSEITPDVFPMEAGLEEGWISYTKGCYLGQETISRLHHLGHVNRRLRGLHLDGDVLPERGSDVLASGKRVGTVTSAARSFRLGRPVALALVHRDAAAVGTLVELVATAGRLAARVTELPF